MNYEQLLRQLYYNPSNPASFGSAQKLFNAGRKLLPNLEYKQVSDWLSGENTYTLHKNARRNFSREKYL